MSSYENLVAWQRCHELVLAVYSASARWPRSEQYGLISQARRAAYSAAANIVEGSAKRGSAEWGRFLDMSLGSLAELQYLLRLAGDLGYLNTASWKTLEEARRSAATLTWRLYRSVRPPR